MNQLLAMVRSRARPATSCRPSPCHVTASSPCRYLRCPPVACPLPGVVSVLRLVSGGTVAQGSGTELKDVEPAVCARFQAVAQEPGGKAEYADIFLEAWMQQLDATEPEFADLRPPSLSQKRGPAYQPGGRAPKL